MAKRKRPGASYLLYRLMYKIGEWYVINDALRFKELYQDAVTTGVVIIKPS